MLNGQRVQRKHRRWCGDSFVEKGFVGHLNFTEGTVPHGRIRLHITPLNALQVPWADNSWTAIDAAVNWQGSVSSCCHSSIHAFMPSPSRSRRRETAAISIQTCRRMAVVRRDFVALRAATVRVQASYRRRRALQEFIRRKHANEVLQVETMY